MQHRDGRLEPYKMLSTRPSADGAQTLHQHGLAPNALTHEHAAGLGSHRHGEARTTLTMNPLGRV